MSYNEAEKEYHYGIPTDESDAVKAAGALLERHGFTKSGSTYVKGSWTVELSGTGKDVTYDIDGK
ncbi:hypothetical protein ACRAWB_15635 [Leifsonia poae]|uniref:hypothetical protein n=1 Tax=Leifsonia poae TaxID=110933 RepID=UPI003D680BC5